MSAILFIKQHILLIVCLYFLALYLPLPLYLFSLALFGIPHVVWEMGFLRSRYGARWPLKWWYMLFGVLLIQAFYRTNVWLDPSWGENSQIIDMVTLGLLFLIVAFAPMRVGWVVRSVGLLLVSVIVYLLGQGSILLALLVLSIVHNFTPLAMVWDLSRNDPIFQPLAWIMSGLFVLPLFLIMSSTSDVPISLFNSYNPLLDTQLPSAWGGTYRNGILSAIVLSQCLHYYSVIYLLPTAENVRVETPVITKTIRIVTVSLVVLILGYYMSDYASARKLYAIASGAHAWLEWPVLLMAFLAINKQDSEVF